jgi:hypothetical protein
MIKSHVWRAVLIIELFFHLLYLGLYLGSLESAKNRHFLKENNVTHILSILNGAKEYYPNDFIYKIIREEDSLSANLLQYFEETFEVRSWQTSLNNI